jgi:hypothetical protein
MIGRMARGGDPKCTKPQLDMSGFGASSDALVQGVEIERFTPRVDVGSDDEWITLWLTEIGISGSGETMIEARHALIENLGFYLDDVEADLQSDPTLSSVKGLLARSIEARQSGKLFELVFGASDGDLQS